MKGNKRKRRVGGGRGRDGKEREGEGREREDRRNGRRRKEGVTSEAVVSLVFTKAAAEISPSFHFLIIVLIFGNFPPK